MRYPWQTIGISGIHDIDAQYLWLVPMINNTYADSTKDYPSLVEGETHGILLFTSMICIICVGCSWYLMFTSCIHDTQFLGLVSVKHNIKKTFLFSFFFMSGSMILNAWYPLCRIFMSGIHDTIFLSQWSMILNICDWYP